MTLADMLDRLERARIGHGEAMRWRGTDSINEVVETVHANGRQMPVTVQCGSRRRRARCCEGPLTGMGEYQLSEG
jgi:hypothetical protein